MEEIKQKQRVSGFNSIFAVSSVPMAKLYYDEFRRQIKADPTKNLKIAVIYSYGANEEEADGILDEENPEDTSALDQLQEIFLILQFWIIIKCSILTMILPVISSRTITRMCPFV